MHIHSIMVLHLNEKFLICGCKTSQTFKDVLQFHRWQVEELTWAAPRATVASIDRSPHSCMTTKGCQTNTTALLDISVDSPMAHLLHTDPQTIKHCYRMTTVFIIQIQCTYLKL